MDVLQQELSTLSRFIELLQQEQVALVAGNVDALQSLSVDKQKLSEQLNSLAQQRAAQVQSAGFRADAEGIRAWLQVQPAPVREVWEKLIANARIAQDLNMTNGKLVQSHLHHHQHALAVLMSAANRSDVYGANGQPLSGSGAGQRILGKG